MSVYALQSDACSSASSRHPQARKVSHIAPFFSANLLERGYDILTIQKLLGHSDVKTTAIYTRVLNRGVVGVKSPANLLFS